LLFQRAETLRWARAGDALTLDPHAQNEGPTSVLAHQIMETLVTRNHEGEMVPSLALNWAPSETNPNIWVFNLREGVTYHDGAAFTAEDVVFSLNRAMTEDSDYKELLASVKEVRANGDYSVEIETNGPNPIMPNNLTNMFSGEDTFAAKNANGTGPYKLVSREPDVKTVLAANENYWGKGEFPLDVTEIIYTPIQNPATRVAALLSGEVDFIQDVPVQDIQRVNSTDGLEVRTAPQNRVIFFGMNMGDEDLANDDVEGTNPFADVRVRRAMNLAINRDAIKQVVMRGQSEPAGMIAPPFVNGWNAEMDAASTTDTQHFPLLSNYETDFYMLGWGVPTYDSEYIFNFLVHGRDEKYGSWNAVRYNNPDLNAKIQSLASNTDLVARNADIKAIWEVVQDEALYIPIHHQVLNWGMAENVGTIVEPEDSPKFKYFTMN